MTGGERRAPCGAMLFTGDSKVRRLGSGSSKAEAESRERLLERTRREREQRARERARAKAATTIQVGGASSLS